MILLGVLGLAFPNAAAKLVGIEPKGKIGISEIRATYGGIFFALGLYGLWTREPVAFDILGFAWVGAAVARTLSAIFDRSRSIKNIGAIVMEFGVAGLFLFR